MYRFIYIYIYICVCVCLCVCVCICAIYDLKHCAKENSRNFCNALKTAKKLLILTLSCKTKFIFPL